MASLSPPWSDLPRDIVGLVIDRLPSASGRRHRRWSASSSRLLFWPAAWSWLLICSACSWLLQALLGSLGSFRAACRSRRHHTADSVDRAHFHAAYRSWCTADSVDRTRFRATCHAHRTVEAVCRSWRAAAREHLPCPPRRLPWILETGYFMTSSGAWRRRLPYLNKNATCIGSTDDWITLHRVVVNNDRKMHSYLLHNPFSETTVPLPELDALIGNNMSVLFEVHKVVMRSSPRDVVALMTNNDNYPIILVRPGKGVWLPRPRSAPFIYIIDIVFIGDRLYGITKAEDLISFDIAFGVDDKPTVTIAKRIIRHLAKAGDYSNVWSNVDLFHAKKCDDGYDLWSDVDEKYHKYSAGVRASILEN